MNQENKGNQGRPRKQAKQALSFKRRGQAVFAATAYCFFCFPASAAQNAPSTAFVGEEAGLISAAEHGASRNLKAEDKPKETLDDDVTGAGLFALSAVVTGLAAAFIISAAGEPIAGAAAFSAAALSGGGALCFESWASARRRTKPSDSGE